METQESNVSDPTQQTVLAHIQRALTGDQQAYAALYNLYAAGVYRLCYSLLLNREDAEDVTQEAFVYAFKNLNRYDERRAAFKTWLYTIAVSRSRNVHRRQRPIALDILDMMRLKTPSPPSEQPEAQLMHQRAREAIATALSGLSPRLREAVVLRYGHGLTYREIAAVMGCPQKTAESRVRLAHDKLRGLLQGEGQGLLDELLSI
jgi:RNA polymerase sigma-70 factor (ECF subfamily)